jgi:serine/threonine protein kinase/Flp pilus assembly protein TadD
MATDRQLVEELFEAALDLPEREREAFLDRACGDSPEIRRLVQELLRRDDAAGSFLKQPAVPAQGLSNKEPEVRRAQSRFSSGEVIAARFVVVRFIARGGMGEVYEVADQLLQGTHIALKVIRPEIAAAQDASHRFEREVLLARKIIHPNLCPIYDISHCDDKGPPFLFLTMKLLGGLTLAERLSDVPRLTVEESMCITRQVVAGIGAIHAANVIHRDIKPNNVMLEGKGSAISVTIMDFGLARLRESDLTSQTTGMIAGTPGYIAPEIFHGGQPSQATDLYALGVLLHELFVGEKPATVSGLRLLGKLSGQGVPRYYAEAIGGLLANHPEARYPAFERLQDEVGTGPQRRSLTVGVPSVWTRRKFALVSAGAFCAASAAAVWKREDLYDAFHPIPSKRFVAILGWPPAKDSTLKPMVMNLIDVIANELSRAEAFDRNLFVAAQKNSSDITSAQQLNEARESLGANLVLAASGVQDAKDTQVSLQVLGPSANHPLRSKVIRVTPDQQLSLGERAVRVAAGLLDVGLYSLDVKRMQAGTENPAALGAFQAGAELLKQPNDAGLNEAIEKFKEAVTLDIHFAAAYAQLAQAYLRWYYVHGDAGILTLVKGNCEAALRNNPDEVAAHRVLALFLEVTGERAAAMREIGVALAKDPSDPRTLIYQGQILTRANRWEDADRALHRALSLRPNYWFAHNELGILYTHEGKYAEAALSFKAASLVSPKNAFPLGNLGAIYLQQGKPSEAIAELEKSLAIHHDNLVANTMAAALRAQGKIEEAIKFAREATSENPSDASNWLELGDCYQASRTHLGDAADAYRNSVKAQLEDLDTNKNDGPGWMLLALVQAKTRSFQEAFSSLSKAEQNFAGDLDSQLYKLRTLELLGDRVGALNCLAACLKRGATLFQFETMPDTELLRRDPKYREIVASGPLAGNSKE